MICNPLNTNQSINFIVFMDLDIIQQYFGVIVKCLVCHPTRYPTTTIGLDVLDPSKLNELESIRTSRTVV